MSQVQFIAIERILLRYAGGVVARKIHGRQLERLSSFKAYLRDDDVIVCYTVVVCVVSLHRIINRWLIRQWHSSDFNN